MTGTARRGVVRRLRRDRRAMAGLFMVAVVLALAALAPVLAPADPTATDVLHRNRPPSHAHWFGTDEQGRDELSRVLYGGRVAGVVALAGVPLALLIALVVGSVSGYLGRGWDAVLMRVADSFYAFPTIIGLLVIVLVAGRGLGSVVLALAVFGWSTMARLLRSSVLLVREAPYVEAARSLGASDWRVVTRHVLPNSLGPVLALAVIRLAAALMALAGLGFLGVGVALEAPDWGTMISLGRGLGAHLWIFPGLALAVTILGFVLLGDGLRDAMDPTWATSTRRSRPG